MTDKLNRPEEDKLLKELYQLAVKYHNNPMSQRPGDDAPDYLSEARPLLRQYISKGVDEVFDNYNKDIAA